MTLGRREGEAKRAEGRGPRIPWLALGRIGALLAVIAVSAYIFWLGPQARRLAVLGYPGIFLIALLSSATVLVPAPGVAIVFTMGSVFNPLLVALAAGTGAGLGEISSYAAGFSGRGLADRTHLYNRILPWMKRYGVLTTMILAALPNPFFDLAGLAAGALRMPFAQFLLAAVVGNILKMLLFAYSGAYSLDWLSGIFK